VDDARFDLPLHPDPNPAQAEDQDDQAGQPKSFGQAKLPQ
jgi:hypothetical protein